MAFKILGGVLPASRGRWLAGVAFAGMMGLSGSASAITVYFDLDGNTATAETATTLAANSTLTGSLVVDTEGTSLYGWGSTLKLSSGSGMSLTSYTRNTATWDSGNTPALPASLDTGVDLNGNRGLNAGVSGIFKLFDFGINIGSVGGALTFVDANAGTTLSDWLDNSGNNVTYSMSDLTVNITPVPIPATFWLFGSGLAGLLAYRRKRMNSV